MPVSGKRQVQIDVALERYLQDEKWGVQDHSPQDWMMILMEEVGEFAQAEMETRLSGAPAAHIREELVQVAAVALAMIECCDRQDWALQNRGMNKLAEETVEHLRQQAFPQEVMITLGSDHYEGFALLDLTVRCSEGTGYEAHKELLDVLCEGPLDKTTKFWQSNFRYSFEWPPSGEVLASYTPEEKK